jgi:hypothetical protein
VFENRALSFFTFRKCLKTSWLRRSIAQVYENRPNLRRIEAPVAGKSEVREDPFRGLAMKKAQPKLGVDSSLDTKDTRLGELTGKFGLIFSARRGRVVTDGNDPQTDR